MLINKLQALLKIVQDISEDVQFAELDEDMQDVIEDLTYNIPIEISVLNTNKEKLDVHHNVDGARSYTK